MSSSVDGYTSLEKILRLSYVDPSERSAVIDVLRKHNAITDGHVAKLRNEDEDVLCMAAKFIMQQDGWQKEFVDACDDVEFPGDEELKLVLRYVARPHDETVDYLISRWTEMDRVKRSISRHMSAKWPDHGTYLRYPWQVYLIHECTTSRELSHKIADVLKESEEKGSSRAVIQDKGTGGITLEIRLKRADQAVDGDPYVILSSPLSSSKIKKKFTTNAKRSYYVVYLELPNDATAFTYTLGLQKDGNMGYLYYGGLKAQRSYKLNPEQKAIGHVLLYDIVNAFRGHPDDSWLDVALCEMHCLLPDLHRDQDLPDDPNTRQISLLDELYYWVQQVLNKWTDLPGTAKNQKVLNGALKIWLEKTHSFDSRREDQIKDRIIGTIFLLGLLKKHHTIEEADVLASVYKALSVHELNADHQKCLLDELMRALKSVKFSFPSICQLLGSLLGQANFQMTPEVILLLPLYWMAREEQVTLDFPQTFNMNSSLPELAEIPGCNWGETYRKLTNDISQRTFLDLFENIRSMCAVHEWMVRSYLHFLRGKTIIQLLNKNSKAWKCFPFAIVMTKLFQCAADSHSEMGLSNIRQLQHYIDNEIEKMTPGSKMKVDESVPVPTCVQIVRSVNAYLNKKDEILENIVWCTDLVNKAAKCFLDKDPLRKKEISDLLDLITKKITAPPHGTSSPLKVWCHLLSYEWANDEVTKPWNDKITEACKERLELKWKENNLGYVKAYMRSPKDLTEPVKNILSEKAASCVEKVLAQTGEVHWSLKPFEKFTTSWSHDSITKILEDLFQAQLQDATMKNGSQSENALRFILSWPPSIRFYKTFYHKGLLDVAPNIACVTNAFTGAVEQVKKGTITQKSLELLLDHSEVACQIHSAISDNNKRVQKKKKNTSADDHEEDLSVLLRALQKQLQKFLELHSMMKKLRTSCQSIKGRVDVDLSTAGLIVLPDISSQRLCDLNANTEKIQMLKNKDKLLIDQLRMILPWLDNGIFKALMVKAAANWRRKKLRRGKKCANWRRKSRRRKRKKVEDRKEEPVSCDWKQALSHILLPAYRELEAYSKMIIGGRVYLRTLRTLHDKCGHEEFKQALWDVCNITETNRKNINSVLKKFDEYMKIVEHEKALKFVLQASRLFKLEGDYSVYHRMQKMVKTWCEHRLKHIDADISISQFPESIKNISEELNAFLRQKKFLKWLQQKVTDVDEINGMCDLALTHTDEMITEKVNCFSNAVRGFAPLIFHIYGEHLTIEDLGGRCETVETNLTYNKLLVEEWNDTADNLQLFEKIELQHSSAEESFLQTAEKINKTGIYEIMLASGRGKSVENAIKVYIPFEDEDPTKLIASTGVRSAHFDKKKIHGYGKLQEIQSVLMLITSEEEKAQQIVSHFSNLFTSVEKVAQAAVVLQETGCMLFCNFYVNIIPTSESEVIIKMSFGQDINPFGERAQLQDVRELAGILEKTQKRWIDYIRAKRMEHYYLNEYNISQMTYLCEHLALSRYNHELPDQVHALLSVINAGLWPDISELLDEATSALDKSQEISLSPGQTVNNDDADRELNSKIQAVRRMMIEDIPEDAAKAAIQAVGEDECTNWYLLNQFDEEIIKKYCDEFDKDHAFSTEGPQIYEAPCLAQNSVQCKLSELVEKLQHGVSDGDKPANLLQSFSTICESFLNEATVITLKNHLSIEHLGRFLSKLRKHASEEQVVHPLLLPLEEGKPNLLICSENSVLTTVLQLYADAPEQQLPTTSEVLICSKQTTADEIERLMRRAMMSDENKGSPLFCLAFIEKLDFAVMKAMEKIFNVLKAHDRMDERYKLVLISCDRKNYLAGCFEKYQASVILKHENLSQYLLKHLVVPDAATESSAHVDEHKRMVKIVASGASGNGKSLYIARQKKNGLEKLGEIPRITTIRLLEKEIDLDVVISKLLVNFTGLSFVDPNFVHIDITPSVSAGIAEFIFNLIILGCIEDSSGRVWRRQQNHHYSIEITDPNLLLRDKLFSAALFNMLPHVIMLTPKEALMAKYQESSRYIGIDQQGVLSPKFQRPFQYLKHLKEGNLSNSLKYKKPDGTLEECIEVLLQNCPIKEPSWSQLKNFASFLNVQLQNCEESCFLDPDVVGHDLDGIMAFATKFMVRMSKDFGIQSLNISDESSAESRIKPSTQSGTGLSVQRSWRDSLHPYVFFSEDRNTMTFINVNLTAEGHLVDFEDKVLEKNIASPALVSQLRQQGVNLGQNFDTYSRLEKLKELCKIMGIEECFDPDPTYELTSDNVQKIIAIYMRMKCEIPVVIMGETGCGKTRMIEFISKLLARKTPGNVKNMIIQKIYGGIKASDIYDSVRKAIDLAKQIRKTDVGGISAVLFLDEANTTDAIHAIKEVMCDFTIDGEPIEEVGLRIIAACNPYKRLMKKAIERLENSGLGSKIHASERDQKGGDKMRTLLYKVIPLPPSMRPYVWDFGQLDSITEELYIMQMVNKLRPTTQMDVTTLGKAVTKAQWYMRNQDSECRLVSLRDVERCMSVFSWLNQHRDPLFGMIENERMKLYHSRGNKQPPMAMETRAILQTIGICYHASLENRRDFRKYLCNSLEDTIKLEENDFHQELIAAQNAFMNGIKLSKGISCNDALRENFFMMAVCADLRIPLFIIGKPGSSKSLAKTVIANNMQGGLSHSKLFKTLKQIRLISYQCSALSDAAGIEGVFRQGAKLQKYKSLDRFTSVIVLDEIGLAEDSPSMPLKILHPLLESGSTESEGLTDFDKVGFIGISNWALDPAKLNRGIFVLRNDPGKADLLETARSICSGMQEDPQNVPLLEALTKGYLKVYKEQDVEYFGLRDYYAMIKMANKAKNADEVSLSIQRNFSSAEASNLDIFKKEVSQVYPGVLESAFGVKYIVNKNLGETDTRFLLLLTSHSPSLNLLPVLIPNFPKGFEVVYGSSFPGDHSYTQICQNINRLKVCMQSGKKVVLLNMMDVHESLYDALNQQFVTLGGKRYVDLGLGGHRVKCCISPKFRLIVIEGNHTAHNEYPIPLLNRLEKHNLDANSLLQKEDRENLQLLQKWVESLTTNGYECQDTVVGFHDDTIPSLVLFCGGDIEKSKLKLLQSTGMDAIFRRFADEHDQDSENLLDTYLREQKHDNLLDLLNFTMKNLFIQQNRISPPDKFDILTYSGILTKTDRIEYEKQLGLPKHCMMVINLEQFQTQGECERRIGIFLKRCQTYNSETGNNSDQAVAILLIQCSQAQQRSGLMECAKHIWANKAGTLDEAPSKLPVIVIFLWSVERPGKHKDVGHNDSFAIQQSQGYQVVYVDDLKPPEEGRIPTAELLQKALSNILTTSRDDHLKPLVKACILEAVRKVFSHGKSWYFDRLEILKNLCTNGDEISVAFCQALMDKMIQMIKETSKEWVKTVANSQESLQDGGTFRKALLLSLKNRISCSFAYIISVIDANQNLDIIASCDPTSWKVNMWMKMFNVWKAEQIGPSLPEVYIIINPGPYNPLKPCELPFSFFVTDILRKIWDRALTKAVTGPEQQRFLTGFRDEKIFDILVKAQDSLDSETLMSAYASDLVSNFYSTISDCDDDYEGELKVVQKILLKISIHECDKIKQKSLFKKGDEVPVVYSTFKKLSKVWEKLSDILRVCPQLIKSDKMVDGWVGQQNLSAGIDVHISALKDGLFLLRESAENIKEPNACLDWMTSATRIKQVIHPILDSIDDQDQKRAIIKSWMPLSLLDLLLLQLIPKKDDQKFAEVIGPLAKLMLKGSEKSDLQSGNFVKIMCNVLRRCYEDIKLKMLFKWGKISCNQCKKKMVNPLQLECNHHICEPCHRNLVTRAMRVCPCCGKAITKKPMPLLLSAIDSDRLERFKSNCTSFFLEFLQNVCFSEVLRNNLPSQADRPTGLILTLIVDANKMAEHQLDSEALHLDLNARGIILGELMKESREEIEREINECLQSLDGEKLVQLVETVIYYMEQILLLEHSRIEKEMENLPSSGKESIKVPEALQGGPTMETLWSVAKARYHIRILGQELQHGLPTEQHIHQIQDIFASDHSTNLREFFVKAGCHIFGMEWYELLRQNQIFQCLIPPCLLQKTVDYKCDFWLLLGDKYKEIRGKLYGMTAEEVQNFMNQLTHSPLSSYEDILAVMRQANLADERIRDSIHACLQKSQSSVTKLLASLEMSVPSLLARFKISTLKAHAVKQLVLTTAAIVQIIHPMMRIFNALALRPNTVQHISLPGIFKIKSDNKDPSSNMTSIVIHILLDLCLIIGMKNDCNAVARMLGERNEASALAHIVIQDLLKNIKDLSDHLGGDFDDAVLILHVILLQISEAEPKQEYDDAIADWATDAGRTKWKTKFHTCHLESIFDNLSEKITKTRMDVLKDLHGNQLHKLVHEVSDSSEEESMLWAYSEHASKPGFLKWLQQSESRGEVLGIIFQTTGLHLVKHLEPALKLQEILISECQNKVRLNDAEEQTLCSYIEMNEEKNELGLEYVKLWNELCKEDTFCRKGIKQGLPIEYFQPMSLSSPVAMVLPNSRGRGQCAKLLVEYLISIQNQFLSDCEEAKEIHESKKEIEVSRLSHSHIVCVDEKQDLLPLIYTHAKYERTSDQKGKQHKVSYNIDVLEKQAEEKFFNYKKKIKKSTIPCIRYTEDAGFGSNWSDVGANIPQRALPDNMTTQVDNAASHHSTVVYDGVRVLSQAIPYIAKGEVEPETKLHHFLRRRLSIPAQDIYAIPTIADVEHTLALYLRLSWHRSVIFMSRGLDPYKDALANVKQEKIPMEETLISALRDAFTHMDLTSFQMHINEIILKIPPSDPDMSMSKSNLSEYNFVIEGKSKDWFFRIPEQVCFKHISHLFELSIRFQNGLPPFENGTKMNGRKQKS